MRVVWVWIVFLALHPVFASQVSLSGWAWGVDAAPLEGAKVWLVSGGDTAMVLPDGSWRLEFRSEAPSLEAKIGSTRLLGPRLDIVSATLPWMSWEVFDVRGKRAGSGMWTSSDPSTCAIGPAGGFRLRRGWMRVRSESEQKVIALAPSTPSVINVKEWFEDLVVDSLVVQAGGGLRTSVGIGGWRRSDISLVQAPGWNAKTRYGSLLDLRDGRRYQTVVVGGTRWMAQNLAFDAGGMSWCPTAGCGASGRVYAWQTANLACPPDWRLPLKKDWDSLGSILVRSRSSIARMGTILKSTMGWINHGGGNDSLGFRLLPSGYRAVNGSWHDQSETGSLWIGDSIGEDSAFLVSAEWSRPGVSILKDGRSAGYGVRCVSP